MADAIEQADGQHRVVAATGYAFTPVVPLIVLASPEMKRDPFLRRHAAQALVWAGPFFLLFIPTILLLIWLLRLSWLAICALPLILILPFVPGTVWALKIYDGRDVRIRGVSSLAERWMLNDSSSPPSS